MFGSATSNIPVNCAYAVDPVIGVAEAPVAETTLAVEPLISL